MTKITHRIRSSYTDGHNAHNDGWSNITLPAIPGVTITTDRSDTAPQTRTIRAAKPRPRPLSPERKMDAVVHAICAARADVLPPVTDAFGGGA